MFPGRINTFSGTVLYVTFSAIRGLVVRDALSLCLLTERKEEHYCSATEGIQHEGCPPPLPLSSVLKNNPLYGDVSLEEAMEDRKKNPSWTTEEYDKRSQPVWASEGTQGENSLLQG